MARADLSHMTCSIARTVEIVGDPWTELVLREMFLGTRRFDDLQRLTGASPHLLSQRLKRLESEDILVRRPYSERPLRHEYRLTEKGRDLWPIVIALKTWGDRWLDGGEDPRITLTHTTCGQTTRPYLVCSACGEPIEAVTSRPHLSPELAVERDAARKK